MSSVRMNEGICSSQTTQPSTHAHKIIHISLSGTGRVTKSLCDFYFFSYLDRIDSRDLTAFSRLTFYGKYWLHNKYILSNILYAMFAIFFSPFTITANINGLWDAVSRQPDYFEVWICYSRVGTLLNLNIKLTWKYEFCIKSKCKL